MARILSLVALLLSMPAAASDWDRLTVRDVIPLCSQDAEACLAFAEAAIDWYSAGMSAEDPNRMPFCVREGDDPAKIFAGLFVWYYGVYRDTYDQPFSPAISTLYIGHEVTWDELLDAPALPSAILMATAYPCPGLTYHPGYAAAIRYD